MCCAPKVCNFRRWYFGIEVLQYTFYSKCPILFSSKITTHLFPCHFFILSLFLFFFTFFSLPLSRISLSIISTLFLVFPSLPSPSLSHCTYFYQECTEVVQPVCSIVHETVCDEKPVPHPNLAVHPIGWGLDIQGPGIESHKVLYSVYCAVL